MNLCLCSRTPLRRLLVTAAWGTVLRRPTRPWSASVLLGAARRVHGFADWVAVRTEDVMIELEDAR